MRSELLNAAPHDPDALVRKGLHLEWVQWLSSFEWDWSVTLTFRESQSSVQAQSYFNNTVNRLNRRLWGRRYYRTKHQVRWVRVPEAHYQGGFHYHCLFGNEFPIPRREMKYALGYWWSMCGRFHVDRVKSDQATIVSYVTKSVRCGGEVDFSPGGFRE